MVDPEQVTTVPFHPAARVRRWSPAWAKGMLGVLSLPFAVVFVFGIYLIQQDLASDTDWLDGLGVALGAAAMGTAAIAVVPSLAFWIRGGRVLYWVVVGWQLCFLLLGAYFLVLGLP